MKSFTKKITIFACAVLCAVFAGCATVTLDEVYGGTDINNKIKIVDFSDTKYLSVADTKKMNLYVMDGACTTATKKFLQDSGKMIFGARKGSALLRFTEWDRYKEPLRNTLKSFFKNVWFEGENPPDGVKADMLCFWNFRIEKWAGQSGDTTEILLYIPFVKQENEANQEEVIAGAKKMDRTEYVRLAHYEVTGTCVLPYPAIVNCDEAFQAACNHLKTEMDSGMNIGVVK